jgi:acyl-CoA reductase-like NAD-dependent aldehyde dehydrogenase
MVDERRPFLVAGEWRSGDSGFDVRSPYDRRVVATVGTPGDADVEEALARAAETFEQSRNLPSHARAEALSHVSERLVERAGEVAESIAREGGKPLKWARVEAARAASTFRWAAEEVRRAGGELLRLDTDPGPGRLGIVRRFPVGPVLGIAPFNFPVNLVAHKVAPALGVGAPIVVKPATSTPLGSLLLGALFAETDLPPGMMSVLPIAGERTEPLVADPRIAKVSFTGSAPIGWRLKALAPKKRFTLELGGNAGVVVHSDADLEHAAARIAFGGYYQAGQSCISVQRIFVHASVFDDFGGRLVEQVQALRVGDPLDPGIDVGPMIDPQALDRVAAWVDEAVAAGAEVLCGGKRRDPFYVPTILANTSPDMKVRCDEVFGPVTTLDRYEDVGDALDEVNNSAYGLQAAIFTSSLDLAFRAHRDLQVGGVIVNDASAYRADQMPYGGSKDSGVGREGLRYAMEEMTEPRIMVLSQIPL